MTDFSHPSWSNAWVQLRNDVNNLAWLFEEEKRIQRALWTGITTVLLGAPIDIIEEITRAAGFGVAPNPPTDDGKSAAAGTLDEGAPSQG